MSADVAPGDPFDIKTIDGGQREATAGGQYIDQSQHDGEMDQT